MAIHKFNSFRRYTPPTCTLEIYHPQPFWGRLRDKSFPPLFSFQLHFDDPRLAKDDQISIIGDRNLLEKLRIKLQAYINKYLNQTTIDSKELTCEVSATEITDEDHIIHLSKESSYSHLLYYQSFIPHPEIIEVVLNNTQILDLINALEAYHWEATQVKAIRKKKSISPSLGIALTTVFATICGFWWWRYQQNDNLVAIETDPSSTQEQSDKDFPAVIPPSPLDSNTIPKTVVSKIPPELTSQQALLPPPPIVAKTTKPSTSNRSEVPSISSNYRKQTKSSNDSNSSMLNVDANDSFSQDELFNSLAQSNQKVSTSSLSSLPVLSSSANTNLEQSSTSSSINNQQNNIAISSPLSGTNLLESSIDNNQNNSYLDLEQNFSSANSSKKVSQDISAEVKQYFQDKWQVPENLQQSIEYRLQVENNGTLTKVTPVGQVAAIFLEQTPIPRNDKIITSSFATLSYLTVRLILSPNGSVQTFAE